MFAIFTRRRFWICAAVFALSSGANFSVRAERAAQAAGPDAIDTAVLKAFKWRSIGPERGGRSIAVSGVKGRAEGGVLRRGRRRPLEDDRRRRRPGRRSPTARSTARRSAPSPCRSPTPTSSTSAWASRASAATFSRATACTSRPTPARPGRTSASTNSDAISQDPHPPDQPRHRVRRRLRQVRRADSDERGVFKTHRRRQDVAEGALPRRQDRRGRHRDRSQRTRT